MSDGALVMSAVVAVSPAMKAGLFVSRDGALSFQENDAVPGVVALAQRGGVLYAATDNFTDGYALGSSSDSGATWQPVVRFDQIGSIMACLRTNPQCQASCESLAGNGLGSPGQIWPEAVCTAGAAAGGASGTGTGGGTGAAGGAAATGGSRDSSGGGCALAPGPTCPSPVWTSFAFGSIAIALRLRRRRRQGGSIPQTSVPLR
jgi:hypothetical protein